MVSLVGSKTIALVVACLVCAAYAGNSNKPPPADDTGMEMDSAEHHVKRSPIGPMGDGHTFHAHRNIKRSSNHQHAARHQSAMPEGSPRNAAYSLPGWDTGIGMLGR